VKDDDYTDESYGPVPYSLGLLQNWNEKSIYENQEFLKALYEDVEWKSYSKAEIAIAIASLSASEICDTYCKQKHHLSSDASICITGVTDAIAAIYTGGIPPFLISTMLIKHGILERVCDCD